jgi:hypothetical protein
VLFDIIPIHLNVPFTEYSELYDSYYIVQFWNRFTMDKPIDQVLYMSQFLDKMVLYGYDFSQFSKIRERNNVKTNSLKRNSEIPRIVQS